MNKQQLDEEIPKIRNFHFFNRYQRDDQSALQISEGTVLKVENYQQRAAFFVLK